jgi:hypothetical protein
MIFEEGAPGLGGRPATSNHILRDRGFRDLDAQLEQFAMNSGRAPKRIGLTHAKDQITDLGIDVRLPTRPALPSPVVPETLTMPANNRVRLNDVK